MNLEASWRPSIIRRSHLQRGSNLILRYVVTYWFLGMS
jgi:hypothetical protein